MQPNLTRRLHVIQSHPRPVPTANQINSKKNLDCMPATVIREKSRNEERQN